MVRLLFILLFSVSVCYGQANRFSGFGYRSTCPVEALKFIDSSGITDATEKLAICTLVKQLKDSLVWDSLIAIYPFVGGTSSTCKWNLKDPRDRDSSYRLTFFGGVTFNGVGMLGNSVNGYANTFFTPTYASYPFFTIGIYLASNINELGAQMGTINGSNNGYSFFIRYANIFYSQTGEQIASTTVANTDSRGFYVATRTSDTRGVSWRDGSLFMTHISTSGSYGTQYPILIGCRNNASTPLYFNTNRTGFALIGSVGLSDAKLRALNTIFQTFKTATGK